MLACMTHLPLSKSPAFEILGTMLDINLNLAACMAIFTSTYVIVNACYKVQGCGFTTLGQVPCFAKMQTCSFSFIQYLALGMSGITTKLVFSFRIWLSFHHKAILYSLNGTIVHPESD